MRDFNVTRHEVGVAIAQRDGLMYNKGEAVVWCDCEHQGLSVRVTVSWSKQLGELRKRGVVSTHDTLAEAREAARHHAVLMTQLGHEAILAD